MKRFSTSICALLFLLTLSLSAQNYVILLHGGAGNGILPENIDSAARQAYSEKMKEALGAGKSLLLEGGTSIDAVVAVLEILENSPLFNAGKGSVYTWEGYNEMDASIMDGRRQTAGAVSGLRHIKNPIMAARAVMEHSEHVHLSGAGAEEFSAENGLERVEASYFETESRRRSLERFKARFGSRKNGDDDVFKMGTVGCVVLDQAGNLAAGTSTGGMTGKRYGRIGDSPIIGAGTYASNETCAISCTGHGEYFIRYAVAYDVHARMKYLDQSIEEAGRSIIHDVLKPIGGEGGLIGLDKEGNILMEFNTQGMFRAYLKAGGTPVIEMFAK